MINIYDLSYRYNIRMISNALLASNPINGSIKHINVGCPTSSDAISNSLISPLVKWYIFVLPSNPTNLIADRALSLHSILPCDTLFISIVIIR